GGEHARLVAQLHSRLADLDALTREQTERLNQFRNSVAVIEGERRAQTRLLESHAERRVRVATEIAGRHRRMDELTGTAATLDGVDELDDLAPTVSPLPLGEGQGEDVPETFHDPTPESPVPIALTVAPDDFIAEPLVAPETTYRRVELLRSRLRAIGAVDAS